MDFCGAISDCTPLLQSILAAQLSGTASMSFNFGGGNAAKPAAGGFSFGGAGGAASTQATTGRFNESYYVMNALDVPYH